MMLNKVKRKIMLNRFLDSKVLTFCGRVKMIAIAFVLYALYLWFFKSHMEQLFRMGQFNFGFTEPLTTTEMFLRACILAPLWEEMAFRYAPFQITRGFSEKKFTIPMIVLSSCVFGVIHGGVANIFVQGVMGVFCSVIYVKSNYKILVPMTLHMLWNSFCLFILHVN